MSQRRDKMDELFPDFNYLGRCCKRLAWISLAFLVVVVVVSASCWK